MNKVLPFLIVILLFVLIGLTLKGNKEIATERIYHYDKERPIAVKSYTVQGSDDRSEQHFTGNFLAHRESKLSAEVPGKVNRISVDVGSQVRKGQVLLQQDNSLLQHQLKSIDVQLEGLEADLDRYEILTKADAIKGVQLEKTQLGIKSALAQKSTLEEQISKCTIYAPFAGIVTMKMTELGSFAAPGMPLLQLTDLSTLDFTLQVPEEDLGYFREGQQVNISVDALENMEVNGRIRTVGSKSNMANAFPIYIAVKNIEGNQLREGMFGKVAMTTDAKEGQLFIPATALLGTSTEPKVYQILNGKVVLQNVKTGRRTNDRIQIIDGLDIGDSVVTGGSINLFDGANVTTQQVPTER